MDFEIVASGSDGNCFVYETIMIDCGVSYTKIKKHLKKIKILLITHVHFDHLNVSTINNIFKYNKNIVIFGNDEVVKKLEDNDIFINTINLNKTIKIFYDFISIEINAFNLYHDAKNYGFLIKYQDFMESEVFCYATDTYTVDNIKIPKCDKIFLEANYDEKTLLENRNFIWEHGMYDYTLRVEYSHLSFEKFRLFCLEFLKGDGIAYLMHKSKKNLSIKKDKMSFEELKNFEF